MTSPGEIEQVDAHTVEEGDEIFMGIHYHNSETAEEMEYLNDVHQAGVRGTVVEAPRDEYRKMLADGKLIMADFVVETEMGNRFRWCIDNGYVLGYHNGLDRRTDIGQFGGFYE